MTAILEGSVIVEDSGSVTKSGAAGAVYDRMASSFPVEPGAASQNIGQRRAWASIANAVAALVPYVQTGTPCACQGKPGGCS